MMSDESINRRKAQLRTELRAKLARFTPEDRLARSIAACRRLEQLEVFRLAQTVMIYMSLSNEVDLARLAMRCFQEGKVVCVPRVEWGRRDMSAVAISSYDDRAMDVDEHGVRSPLDGEFVIPSMIDLIIIPGLGFDAAGNRLGRGGGFYDRFLTRLARPCVKVALAFDEQIVDDVPMEAHDIAVDIVITDRRVVRMGRSSLRR